MLFALRAPLIIILNQTLIKTISEITCDYTLQFLPLSLPFRFPFSPQPPRLPQPSCSPLLSQREASRPTPNDTVRLRAGPVTAAYADRSVTYGHRHTSVRRAGRPPACTGRTGRARRTFSAVLSGRGRAVCRAVWSLPMAFDRIIVQVLSSADLWLFYM